MTDIPKEEHRVGKDREINSVEYPQEFFDAQVRFARKWAQLNQQDFFDVLRSHTMIFKKVTSSNDDEWETLVEKIKSEPDAASRFVYDQYLSNPDSLYVSPNYDRTDGKHFGFFGFDYYPNSQLNEGQNTVKIHFINTKRGTKSALDHDFLFQRRQDVKRMFDYIKEKYPEAQQVVGGSWIYNLPAYRDSFPDEFTRPENMRRLVPPGYGDIIPNSTPNMIYTGTSVWGQFVDRKGWVRALAYEAFIKNINTAHTPLDLVNSFPEPTLQPKVPISVFHNWKPSA